MTEHEDVRGIALPFLEAWRLYCLLTQRQLAEQSGVSRSTIVAAEHGARLRVATIDKLARALALPSSTLAHTPPPRNAPPPAQP